MTSERFAGWLAYIGWAVLLGGWALAVAAFFIVDNADCARVEIPLAPAIEVCQDTTPQSVILLVVVGFGATLGSVLVWSLSHFIRLLAEIEANTRRK